MPLRLVLCFDGTWDKPDSNAATAAVSDTNVVKFYEAVLDGAMPDGSTQTKWYDSGVGTANWYDQVAGGVFGYGIDQKIQDGYQWLVDNYPDPDPGDVEVYLFGFSRGAYTARSLLGMIRNVGLLKSVNVHRLSDAYQMYRDRDDGVDSPAATAFRAQYSRDIRIKCIGVWDTVGALGVPLQALQWLNSAVYAFHDTSLSKIADNAFQALAIDEHRIDFQACLWTDAPDPGQNVSQTWFPGAHGDIGGGDPSPLRSDIALFWMMQKLAPLGLTFDPTQIPALTPQNTLAAIYDSYGLFLNGLYAQTHPVYYRPIGTTPTEGKDGSGGPPGYDPKNPGF